MLKRAMGYVIDPPPQPSVAVSGGGDRFPVRRIFCVGRNYADHVREMGNDPSEPPLFFTKPADAVTDSGAVLDYPPQTANWHHEVELVIAIGVGGAGITEAAALEHVWGYGVGVDLTLRDRQAEAKQAGAPWDVAKGGDASAPIGALTPKAACGDIGKARIWLSVNDALRQDASTGAMIWKPPATIAHVSRIWRLQPGDLIFTGSPAGVGPLVSGDSVACGVDGLAELRFSIR